MSELTLAFALLAGVLAVSALAAGLVERAPLSFPMIFLSIGLLVGDGVLGWLPIRADTAGLDVLATLTLALVLFLDAVNLERAPSRRDWLVPVLALGPGTALVTAMIAGAAMLLLGFPPLLALMLAAVLSSTDPVVLRDVVRDTRIPGSVRRALSVEAGMNDIVVLPVLLILIAVSRAEAASVGEWVSFAARIFLLGPAAGFAVGAVGSRLMAMADRRFGIRREYQSLYGVGLVLGAYSAGVGVGGDGFLAAFAAGLAVPLLNEELCDCFLEFGQAAAEMAMLLAFVLFGALLSGTIGTVPLLPTLVLAGFAIFVARPLAIWLVIRTRSGTLSPGGRAFIAWFGPRGLNSLLFALIVVQEGVAGGTALLAVAGLVVVVSVFAHGASATPLSAWYGRRVARETLEEERASTASGLFEAMPGEAPRMTADELAQRLAGAEPPVVLDVRSRSQYQRDRIQIPGSVRVVPDEVAPWAEAHPPVRPVVAYCT